MFPFHLLCSVEFCCVLYWLLFFVVVDVALYCSFSFSFVAIHVVSLCHRFDLCAMYLVSTICCELCFPSICFVRLNFVLLCTALLCYCVGIIVINLCECRLCVVVFFFVIV